MLRKIAHEVIGSGKVTYQEVELDFDKPFKRMTLLDAILEKVDGVTLAQLENYEEVSALAKSMGIAVKDNWGAGKIQLEIFEEKVEESLQQPTLSLNTRPRFLHWQDVMMITLQSVIVLNCLSVAVKSPMVSQSLTIQKIRQSVSEPR